MTTDTGLTLYSIDRADRIAEQLRHRARDGADGALVRTVEKIPAALTHNLETLDRRITQLEERPEPDNSTSDHDGIACQHDDRIAAIEGQLQSLAFLLKRLDALEGRITEAAARVDEIDGRPYVSRETLAQLDDGLNAKISRMIEQAVNQAMGDVRSRLITVEKTTTTTTGGEADSAKLNRLAEMIGALGKYVSDIESTVEARHDDVERRYAELAEHIAAANLNTMKVSTRLYRALQALEHDEERGAA